MLLPSVEALSYTKPASTVPFKIEETQTPRPKQKSTKLNLMLHLLNDTVVFVCPNTLF